MPDIKIVNRDLKLILDQHKMRFAAKRLDPKDALPLEALLGKNLDPRISGLCKAIAEIDADGLSKPPSLSWTFRIDIDGWYPQNWISAEIRKDGNFFACIIFKVHFVTIPKKGRLRIEGSRIHGLGNISGMMFDSLILEAEQGASLDYERFTLTLGDNGYFERGFELKRSDTQFGSLEIEIDNLVIEPASEFRAPVTTTLHTKDHDGNLSSLAAETLTLPKIFGRAGLKTKVTLQTKAQSTDLAGDDKLWSDSELHNAMQNYWQKNSQLPQWAAWAGFVDTHETGRDLLGVMFDHVDDAQRQGCAVFLDSYIANLPLDDFIAKIDPLPTAKRRVFFTLIHELGHVLNLGHSFEKSDAKPWLALTNDKNALSFMNYPENTAEGVKGFFAKFAFRFDDDELKFIRHAPRDFIMPGNASWNQDHGALQPPQNTSDGFMLNIGCDHGQRTLEFMEPLWLHVSLANMNMQVAHVDQRCLNISDGLAIMVQRSGSTPRTLRPYMRNCRTAETIALEKGQSISSRQFISADVNGWLIDAPGLYEIQASLTFDGVSVRSNILRLYVAAPSAPAQEQLAADYFSSDVGRLFAFDGVPAFDRANATLDRLIEQLPDSAAGQSAIIARHAPELTRYKIVSRSSSGVAIKANPVRIARETQLRLRRLKAGETQMRILLDRMQSSRTRDQLIRWRSGLT